MDTERGTPYPCSVDKAARLPDWVGSSRKQKEGPVPTSCVILSGETADASITPDFFFFFFFGSFFFFFRSWGLNLCRQAVYRPSHTWREQVEGLWGASTAPFVLDGLNVNPKDQPERSQMLSLSVTTAPAHIRQSIFHFLLEIPFQTIQLNNWSWWWLRRDKTASYESPVTWIWFRKLNRSQV